jgi:hypothetical protein
VAVVISSHRTPSCAIRRASWLQIQLTYRSPVDQQRAEPRGTANAVTVGEGMDEDEPMVHADREFDREIGPVVEPVARVVKENAQLDTDLRKIDADVGIDSALFTRPPP